MYGDSHMYAYPHYGYAPIIDYGRQPQYYATPDWLGYENWPQPSPLNYSRVKDHGRQPFVINIEDASEQNNTFRTAIWTGNHLQVTLMSIAVGEDIGLEIHPHTDQFLRIEDGRGFVQMGKSRNHLNFQREVGDDDAIMVPMGTWHNVTNIGNRPLKLYSIYAPPEHPFGTIHRTKMEAIAAEKESSHHVTRL